MLLALTRLGFRKKEAEARLRAAQQTLSLPVDRTPADPASANLTTDSSPLVDTESGDADFQGLLRAALAA